MSEFIAQCWFMAKVHREDGDADCEADAAAYVWAAVDAGMYQNAGYSLSGWIARRLDDLPGGAFQDDTINEIRDTAMDIKMGIDSGGHL